MYDSNLLCETAWEYVSLENEDDSDGGDWHDKDERTIYIALSYQNFDLFTPHLLQP